MRTDYLDSCVLKAAAMRPGSHLKLCDQFILGIGAETWTPWDLDRTVNDGRRIRKRSRPKIRKHPLQRSVLLFCRHAMQHRQVSWPDVKSIRHASRTSFFDLSSYL